MFRARATNVLNHFDLLTARLDINPNDGANLGTMCPGQTPTADSPPRNLNLGFKVSFEIPTMEANRPGWSALLRRPIYNS